MKKMVLICLLFVATAPWESGARAAENEPGQKIKRSGWMGVFVQDVDKKLAKKENLKINEGAYISEVADDSPADSAGLLRGDVVIRFAEQTIENADGLMRVVRKTKPGTQISLVSGPKRGRKEFFNKSWNVPLEAGIYVPGKEINASHVLYVQRPNFWNAASSSE